nr:uncharacterized protein LOC124808640 [Hydra vulgaris]
MNCQLFFLQYVAKLLSHKLTELTYTQLISLYLTFGFESNENNLNYSDSDLYLNEEDCMLSESEDFVQYLHSDSSDNKDSESKEDSKEKILTIADHLLMFFITINISHHAMLYLLKLLIKFGVPDVPNSIYLLTKKSQLQNLNIVKLSNGNFFYFSIIENLKYCIDKGVSIISSTIDFIFNVDGLPLFKSSGLCAWPVLLYIPQFKSKFPLPVSVYCGTVKPDLCTLVTDLCDELSLLKSQGLVYKNVKFVINSIIFVCDAPARAMLQGIKYHTANFGCSYCRIKGETIDHRTLFLKNNCDMRNDFNYLDMKENNQVILSPLAFITGIGLHSSFPPEYQHLVCLGVCKKLCFFYFTSVPQYPRLPCKLSLNQMSQVSEIVKNFSKFIPIEFHRKIRPLSELCHYKATEYRFFLLYLGPFLLKKILLPDFYEHFLLLHYATYCLCSNSFNDYIDCAKGCISHFVSKCPELFTPKCMSYNFHVLLHLPYFVNLYQQPLDYFSTFRFENYLSILKRKTKATSSIFPHLLSNMRNIRDQSITERVMPLIFNCKPPDNCCVTPQGIILITNVLSEPLILVSGYILKLHKNLYTIRPYESSSLGIGILFKIYNIYEII